jgi:hypothetical protein
MLLELSTGEKYSSRYCIFCIWNVLMLHGRITHGFAAAVVNTAFSSTHTFAYLLLIGYSLHNMFLGCCKGKYPLV